jgi:hypothetical protein
VNWLRFTYLFFTCPQPHAPWRGVVLARAWWLTTVCALVGRGRGRTV